MVYSLAMQVSNSKIPGHIEIRAPWIDGFVVAPTFEEAYELAMFARRKRHA